MKKFLLILLLILVGLTNAKSAILYGITVDDLVYNIDTDARTASVTRGDYNFNGYTVLEIPSSITYKYNVYSVTEIGERAFNSCKGLWMVTIPNSVTEIGQYAFSYCSILVSVTIPNSVTSIGSGAFQGSSLTSVSIPSSVTEIRSSTFFGCSNLGRVSIPNSVTSIGSGAFQGCSSLTSVSIPNSVTEIQSLTFQACINLKSVVIPNSVTSIGNSAFNSCSSLTSVTIPNSVTSIGNSAFYGCSRLTSVEIPNSVTSIRGSTFYQCKGLTSVEIPNSVTSIGDDAFYGCSGLTSVEIPNSVTSIGEDAFSFCSGLKSVIMGNSVTSIGSGAFSSCSGLTSVEISDLEAWCRIRFTYSSNPLINAHRLYLNGKEITELKIPNSVTEIGQYAFQGCSGLTSVEIPNSVTSIGGDAFRDCSGLTSVIIGNSVTSIGGYAFDGCSGLTEVEFNAENCQSCGSSSYPIFPSNLFSVKFGDNVKTIPENAFYGCSGLTSLIIPNSITSIGKNTFSNCGNIASVIFGTSLQSINTNAFTNTNVIKAFWLGNTPPSGYADVNAKINYVSNSNYNLQNKAVYPFLSSLFKVEGLIYVPVSPSERTCELLNCAYDKEYNEISIKDNVSYNGVDLKLLNIGSYAFYDNPFITDIDISNAGIKSLANYAFASCTSLKKIQFPNTLESIGTGALENCNSLNELILPESLASIGQNAFRNCTSLSAISIPPLVSKLNNFAFDRCEALANVTFSDSDLPLSLGSNGKSPLFAGCALEEVYIGRKLSFNNTQEGGFSPFYGNTSLKKVVFNNNEETIYDNEFNGCTALTSAVLGAGITSIGASAFMTCESLSSIIIGNGVTSIGASAFNNCESLGSIVIPDNVMTIGTSAFEGCTGLESISLSSGLKELNSRTFYGCSVLGELKVPGAVTNIDDYVFSGCSALASLTFEEGGEILKLGSNGNKPLFADCQLDNIYIGRKLSYNTSSSYGYSPFYGNKSLLSVEFNDYEDAIYTREFYGCENLESVTLGNGIKTIESEGFYGCSNLFAVSLGNGLKTIGGNAFGNCSSLESIVIPDSVTSIGNSVFSNCILLSKVKIGCSVESIGQYAFSRCNSLTHIEIGNSVETLGAYVFRDCASLPEISIPTSVNSIGNYAFSGCKMLRNFTLEDDDSKIALGSNGSSPLFADCPLEEAYIGRQLSYTASSSYGYSPFYRNTTLKTVTIRDPETQIYNNEFYGCSSLETLIIGNGVKNIGKWAFSGCSSLNYFSAGYKVETIGEEAFSDCIGLTQYYSLSSVPPVCGKQALDDINKWTCTLYVPAESEDEYMAADQWKEFFFINAMDVVEAETIILNMESSELLPDETLNLYATVLPENTTFKSVTWTSSDTVVATVDADGMVTAVSVGEATITATCGEASASCVITVLPVKVESLTLNYQDVTLEREESVQLTARVMPENATDKTVIWTSSDQDVATVNADGLVTAVSVGEATVTATCGEVSATCNITVLSGEVEALTLNYQEVSLEVERSVQLTATVSPENIKNKTVTWTSSDQDVATVNADGLVKAVSIGDATITATCGGVSATCKITVLPIKVNSLRLNYQDVTLEVEENVQLTARVMPENATDKTVAWTSSDTEVATVNADGLVTALSVGDAVITATCGVVSATCKITVLPIEAEALTMNYQEVSLEVEGTVQLTATVSPENATDKTVAWTSSDTKVATVNADGLVTAVSVGDAVITATCGDVSATCKITVLPIEVESLTLNYQDVTLEVEGSVQLTATVSPENATEQSIVWSSSDESVASVNQSGMVTGLSVGSAVIKATCGGVSAECKVTVTDNGMAYIDQIDSETDEYFVVFNYNGVLILSNATKEEIKKLEQGIYIVVSKNDGKSVKVKI